VDSSVNAVLQCPRGHEKTPENTFGKNQCKACHKLATAAYEKTSGCRKYRKQWASSPKRKEYAKAYYNGHKEQARAQHFQKKYGLSMEQLAAMFSKQDGKCAICGVPGVETTKGLVVDHNHKTGQVRGLLCNVCNSHVVHAVEDYPDRIESAKRYLEGF